MEDREGRVRCWNTELVSIKWTVSSASNILAANLSHDHHESDRSNVGALAAHVAASYDLEACLLC